MIAPDHVIEIALLVLVAYLVGCFLGYGAHLAIRSFAARPKFESRLKAQVVSNIEQASATATPARRAPPSAARRLAGAVERETAVPAKPLATPPQQRPIDLPVPRDAKPDDLKKIKGIGPKTESALNDLGIYHHDQIAAWTEANIDWLEGRIAVKGRIRREQWVEQAILLATATA